jgi:hypothetical protein
VANETTTEAVERQLLILDVRFDTMSIWTRIMDLPFGWMNDKKGLKIAKLIDKQCSVDVDEFGEASGTFLRARVDVDVIQVVTPEAFIKGQINSSAEFDFE